MGVVIELRRPAPRQAEPDFVWATDFTDHMRSLNVEECRADKIADLRSGTSFREVAGNIWTLAGCRTCKKCRDLSGGSLC